MCWRRGRNPHRQRQFSRSQVRTPIASRCLEKKQNKQNKSPPSPPPRRHPGVGLFRNQFSSMGRSIFPELPQLIFPEPAVGQLFRTPPTHFPRTKIRNFPRPRPLLHLWPITRPRTRSWARGPGPGPRPRASGPGTGRVPKIVTPTTLWPTESPKMQPLQHIGGPGSENCNPYNTFGPRGWKTATPTTLWSLGGCKLQPLQHFGNLPSREAKYFEIC